MEKFIPYHQHLIVKGFFNKAPKDTKVINQWFVDLVDIVDMKVTAGPISSYVEEVGNEGLTGAISLSTSHASIHIWDAEVPSLFQFDIYSCKKYDINDVFKKLDDFDLFSYEYILLDRNGELKITKKGSF